MKNNYLLPMFLKKIPIKVYFYTNWYDNILVRMFIAGFRPGLRWLAERPPTTVTGDVWSDGLWLMWM
jgi:hypothetical protein